MEQIIDSKINFKPEVIEKGISKDIENLKQLIDKNFSTKADLADVKSELLKWLIVLFLPFYIGMIVFLIKQFM